MKKTFYFIFCVFIVTALGSCSSKTIVDVSFVAQDGSDICSQSITVDKKESSAWDIFSAVASHNEIPVTESNGMILSVNNIESTDSEGWLFYINDKISTVGVKEYIPQGNDKIQMKYASYSEAFPEFESSESAPTTSNLVFGTYKASLWYDSEEDLCFTIDEKHATAFDSAEPDIKEINDYVKHDEYIEMVKDNVSYKIGYNDQVLYYRGYEFPIEEALQDDTFDIQGIVGGYDYHIFKADGTLEFGVISPSGFYDPYCKGTYKREGNLIKCYLVAQEYYDTASYCSFYIDNANKRVLTRIFERID